MTTEVLPQMTEVEARQELDGIKQDAKSLRQRILKLYDQDGWRVLGYDSWTAFVNAELSTLEGITQQYACRQLNAAIAEKNILNGDTPMGVSDEQQIPERQLRPLSQVEPENQAQVWQTANETAPDGKLTAAHVQETVNQHKKEIELVEPKVRKFTSPNHITLDEWKELSENNKADALAMHGTKQFNSTNENVEWALWTWNPVTGCRHGCDFCYARDIANRFYTYLEQPFEPVFYPERLTAPENTKQPDLDKIDDPVLRMGKRNVFVCSMADLFGKWVPAEWIEAVLEQVRVNPQWNFLFLTKFPKRMAEFDFPENAWVGTTVDNQAAVKRAETAFRKITAGLKWLSCEPMMERLTFESLDMFDWVVVGGASKSSQTDVFYPPHEWIYHLYNQAVASGCVWYEKTNLYHEEHGRMKAYPIDES